MSLAAFIMGFIKVVPALERIYVQTVELYFKHQEAADQDHYNEKKIQRDALILSMGKEGVTDEELKNIRRALYNLNRG